MCGVLQYLEHRSCGGTQPLTLPEYGNRKTIIPLTVENIYIKRKDRREREGKGRNLNGRREAFFLVHIRNQRNLNRNYN